METKNKAKKYFKTFLNIATGAGAVVGGAYIFSRIKEKQDIERRLERMEQIVEEISSSEEEKGKE
jgi:pyridoxal/pyridoxine/pyridoxamine kinase